MKKRITKKLIILMILIILLFNSLVFAKNYYQIFTFSKPEILGRGGAMTGTPSQYNFYGWNPAAYSCRPEKIKYNPNISFTFDIMRFGKFFIDSIGKHNDKDDDIYDKDSKIHDWDYDDEEDDDNDKGKVFVAILLNLMRSIKEGKVNGKNFYLGFNIFENLSLPAATENYAGFQNHYHSLVFGYKFFNKISFGYELDFVHLNKQYKNENDGFGSIFGIFAMPYNNFGVGLSYVNYSDRIKYSRNYLDRIVDDSLNLGLSYSFKNLCLSYDLKNLNQFESEANLESHFGLNYRFKPKFTKFRFDILSGYFKNIDDDSNNYSIGFSAFTNARRKGKSGFYLNCTTLIEKHKIQTLRHYFFSLGYSIL